MKENDRHKIASFIQALKATQGSGGPHRKAKMRDRDFKPRHRMDSVAKNSQTDNLSPAICQGGFSLLEAS